MNAIPPDWSDQLSAAYPKRSGPSGWKGTKLLFALRRALFDATWDEILTGVKRYADYCRKAGIEGTPFVKAPQTFIEDGSWAEEYEFSAPETKEQRERRELAERDRARFAKAVEAGRRCIPVIVPFAGESVGAFETRVRLAKLDERLPASVDNSSLGSERVDMRQMLGDTRARGILSLAARMRVK